MIDFNTLRSNANGGFKAMQKQLDKQSGSTPRDPRLWKPTRTAALKTNAIVRFLPIPFVDYQKVQAGEIAEDSLTPIAKILKHGFQGAKGWYIENSLGTFGEDCPVREHDQPIWKTAKQTNDKVLQDVLKKRLPQTTYYANVLVIKDEGAPENEGKVKIYQFGAAIRNMIEAAANPEFEGVTAIDAFDPFGGASLVLRDVYEMKQFNGKEVPSPVKEKSQTKWGACEPIGDDAFIEKLWNESHSIAEFYDRKNFKEYAVLRERFCKVMDLDENYNPKVAGESNHTPSAPAQQAASVAPAQASVTQFQQATTMTGVPAQSTPAPTAQSADLDEFERLLGGNM